MLSCSKVIFIVRCVGQLEINLSSVFDGIVPRYRFICAQQGLSPGALGSAASTCTGFQITTAVTDPFCFTVTTNPREAFVCEENAVLSWKAHDRGEQEKRSGREAVTKTEGQFWLSSRTAA